MHSSGESGDGFTLPNKEIVHPPRRCHSCRRRILKNTPPQRQDAVDTEEISISVPHLFRHRNSSSSSPLLHSKKPSLLLATYNNQFFGPPDQDNSSFGGEAVSPSQPTRVVVTPPVSPSWPEEEEAAPHKDGQQPSPTCKRCSRLRPDLQRAAEKQRQLLRETSLTSAAKDPPTVLHLLRNTFSRLFESRSKSTRPPGTKTSSEDLPDLPQEFAVVNHQELPTNGSLLSLELPGLQHTASLDTARGYQQYLRQRKHTTVTISSSLASIRGSTDSLATSSLSSSPDANDPDLASGPGPPVWLAPSVDYDVLQRRNPRLTTMGAGLYIPTHSCPTKCKSLNSQYSQTAQNLLCASWPPSGKRIFLPDGENEYFQSEEEIIIDYGSFQKDSVYEFNIPFSDIKLGECIKSGVRRKIFRGQWHGEVMVHLLEDLNHEETSRFWKDVSKLSMTRHENIALFMGACMDPPNFAVVTNVLKGISLFEKLHISREKTHQSFKLEVMRHVAQAIGYLHARNKAIVVRRLNSKNIFLEPRVILCLLDYSLPEDVEERCGYLPLPNNLLWYAAPELLSECQGRNNRRMVEENQCSLSTDVFAFGTLMYELHMNRYPFHKTSPVALIKDICLGKREDTKELHCSETVKNLVRDCWSHDALCRPEFSLICRELMQRHAAHKRRSSSEPENIHRLGNTLSYTY